MSRKAVVYGITGQDGSYLADLLLSEGYEVRGVARRTSTDNRQRIRHLDTNDMFSVVEGDITDYASIINVMKDFGEVDEIYNLAAQSHVGTSFKQPGLTWDITGKGCMNLLQVLIDLDMRHVKFYQASSSEMFGSAFTLHDPLDNISVDKDLTTEDGKDAMKVRGLKKYQDEDTKFLPQSPYAISKCAAHMAVRLYREAYGLHASCGILFNHESPRRGENFVTRKITKWIGDYKEWCMEQNAWEKQETQFTEDHIHIGDQKTPKLRLGNLESKRDWGHAKDYVRAMYLMVQQAEPDDYVICTGETRSIKDFLDAAFKCINISDWSEYVVVDPEFYRPAEVDYLLGSCKKAEDVLGWKREYDFCDLVREMIKNDTHQPNENLSCRSKSF